MLIRKNTKAFKTILEIVTACRDRQDREQLIRVFITKAGDTVKDRISVEGIEGGAALFYEMNYQAVLGNLKSSNHQLNHSDETPGLYFFHSSSNKVWDETPFEFDEAIKKEFSSLPELPVLRKKEKAGKFVFPNPKVKTASGPASKKADTPKRKDNSGKVKPEPKKQKKATPERAKPVMAINMGPRQPDYKLKQEIQFTGLERIVLRQSQLTKRDVLDYYNKVADYLLPYLKDRPQFIRLQRDGHSTTTNATLESLVQTSAEEIPDWIRTYSVVKGKAKDQMLLCNDKEHLLFFVQIGCLEFMAGHSRTKSPETPDYGILVIESPEYELAKAIDAALAAKEIFEGLQLPSFVKTDGTSALHIYIPLDSRSGFDVSKKVVEYLCKLIRLKVPDLVTIKGTKNAAYGKVSLDYQINEPGRGIVAPYSLVAQSSHVATPLSWDEVKAGLRVESFDHKTIFKRLMEKEDPFEPLFRKKIDAEAVLKRMEEDYSFLF